jgi:hypothetical protein
MKQMGARSAGNPHAACDVAGTGNVAWPRYCDTRKRKSETTGNTNFDLNRRASPRPYREVQILKKAAAKESKKKKTSKTSRKPVAIVSYDEKPGIQAIATTSPDLPPVPGTYATFSRDHEYKRQCARPSWRDPAGESPAQVRP